MAHSIRSPEHSAILLTRPKAQSEAFAQDIIAALGRQVEIVISPLMEVKYLFSKIDSDQKDGFVFTSEHGVRGYARLSEDRSGPAFCVGEKTAATAKSFGFEAISAGGTADELASLIRNAQGVRQLLYPHGAHIARDLGQMLEGIGTSLKEVIVYMQNPLPLTPEAISLLEAPGPILVPLFSPRTAELFEANLSKPVKSSCVAICLSEAVRRNINPAHVTQVYTCDEPNAAEMLRIVERLVEEGSA